VSYTSTATLQNTDDPPENTAYKKKTNRYTKKETAKIPAIEKQLREQTTYKKRGTTTQLTEGAREAVTQKIASRKIKHRKKRDRSTKRESGTK
jgi:hypothetical protein